MSDTSKPTINAERRQFEPTRPPWQSIEVQRKIQWRNGDVVVSVPAKSGTTWTMNIVHQLREGGDRNLEDVYAEVPWLEVIDAPGRTVSDMVQKIDSMPHSRPRAFKAHSSPPTLPFRDEVKYIVVLRNPEEALVSLRPFLTRKPAEFYDLWGVPQEKRNNFPSFAGFYKDLVIGKHFYSVLFNFVSEWWKLRDHPNVLMLHYNDMKEDHEGSVRSISDFLGYGPYSDEQWQTILECTSFTWMKTHECKFEGRTIWPVPCIDRGAMMRQGSSGLARQDGMTGEIAQDLSERGRKILTNSDAFDWFYNGGKLASQESGAKVTLEDLLADGGDGANLILEVTSTETIKKPEQLDEEMTSQLTYIVTGEVYFGDQDSVRTITDCFNERNVDDGIVFYKEMRFASSPHLILYYWLGYFGGNPTGYLLRRHPCNNEQVEVLIENCDTDFIWRGGGGMPCDDAEAVKTFIKCVKRVVYGEKYYEDE